MNTQKLPSDYVHPNGYKMGGYFGLYEDGRLIIVAKTEAELAIYMPVLDWECGACGQLFDNESAIIDQESQSSEYCGTVQNSIVSYVCCPSCGSDEIKP